MNLPSTNNETDFHHCITLDLIKSFPFKFDRLRLTPKNSGTEIMEGHVVLIVNHGHLFLSSDAPISKIPADGYTDATIYRTDQGVFRISTLRHGDHVLNFVSTELVVGKKIERFQANYLRNYLFDNPNNLLMSYPIREVFLHNKKEIVVYGKHHDVMTFIRFVYDGLITLNIITDHPVVLLDPGITKYPTTVLITSAVRISDISVKTFI